MAPRPPAGPPRQGRFAQPGAWRKGPSSQSAAPAPPAAEAPPPAAAGPPRKPAKPKPVVNLTPDKKEGKAALNTFGELFAFFKTRDEPEPPKTEAPAPAPPPEPTVPPTEPPAEQPPSAA
jgi:protein Tex